MVLRYWYDKLRARLSEKSRPCYWVETLATEALNKILIANVSLVTVHLAMMLELTRTGQVHIAWVPFVAEPRHAVWPPMDEDAKLPILVPPRRTKSR